nr:membrane alanyl aminopeptidase-like [Drosophila takahashii]
MKWSLLLVVTLTLGLTKADSSYNHYRLPVALWPQKYDLRNPTRLENPEEFRFNGTVKIQIEALLNANNITLHSKGLDIDESQITLRQISGGRKKSNCVTSREHQVPDCVPQSLAYFRSWRSAANPDEKNPVPKDVRSIVYCAAIKYGSDEDWEFLWTRYQKSNVATETLSIIDALSCSREVWLLQRLLEMIFDSKIKDHL